MLPQKWHTYGSYGFGLNRISVEFSVIQVDMNGTNGRFHWDINEICPLVFKQWLEKTRLKTRLPAQGKSSANGGHPAIQRKPHMGGSRHEDTQNRWSLSWKVPKKSDDGTGVPLYLFGNPHIMKMGKSDLWFPVEFPLNQSITCFIRR